MTAARQPVVRISYLIVDTSPVPPGYEALLAVLDPPPSKRWRTLFERLVQRAPGLLRTAALMPYRDTVTARICAPESRTTEAIHALKALVGEASDATKRLHDVPLPRQAARH